MVGGPWAFHYPEEGIKEGADIVVVGEAELTIEQVLHHLSRQQFGVIIRADGMADLLDSPPPRYDLLEQDNYLNASIQFSRGCPFNCEFCDVTATLGRKVRTKNPQQILVELQMLYDLGRRGYIFIVDDSFIGNVSKAKALLQALIPWQEAHGWPFEFYTQCSVNLASDGELLDQMVNAGFYKVFLGIETLDTESLKRAKKHQNTVIDLSEACININRAGIGIIAGCIIGFDKEEPAADERLIQFALKTQIPEMFVSVLQAVEGSDLWNRLAKEGRLLACPKDNVGNQNASMNFSPTRSLKEIYQEFVHVYEVLYSREAYLERSYRHINRMEPKARKKKTRLLRLFELRALLLLVLRHGIKYPTRLKFWKYVLLVLWNSPQEIARFIDYCAAGEHYFQFRQAIKDELLEREASSKDWGGSGWSAPNASVPLQPDKGEQPIV